MKLYNPFKTHTVQFSNGKYGLRHLSLFSFGWVYKDLKNGCFDWSKESQYFKDCMVDKLEDATYHLITEKVI